MDQSELSAAERRLREVELQVEELRRINEQLGAELVRGPSSRYPRAAAIAARNLTATVKERDGMQAQLETAQRELRDANEALDHFRRENERLRFEAARLRFGPLGFLRRALARLARR